MREIEAVDAIDQRQVTADRRGGLARLSAIGFFEFRKHVVRAGEARLAGPY